MTDQRVSQSGIVALTREANIALRSSQSGLVVVERPQPPQLRASAAGLVVIATVADAMIAMRVSTAGLVVLQAIPATTAPDNPGAETGDLAGWTETAGTFVAATSFGALAPFAGTYLFAPSGAAVENVLVQTIDLDSHAGFERGTHGTVRASAQQGQGASGGKGQVKVTSLASDGTTVLATHTSPLQATGPVGQWAEVTTTRLPIPAEAKYLRIELRAVRVANENANTAFDRVRLNFEAVEEEPPVEATDANDDGPVAATIGGAPVQIAVLANDAGQALTVTGVTQPAQGSAAVTGSGAHVTYTPPASGTEATPTFDYTVSGANGSDTATVTVALAAAPAAPASNSGINRLNLGLVNRL